MSQRPQSTLFFVRLILTSCILLLSSSLSKAQYTDSSLPIVYLNIYGIDGIPNYKPAYARMRIIDNGPGVRNHLADTANAASLNYDGRIEISVRGQTSQFLNKKQYKMSTLLDNNLNNNVSLLGMPKEHDWILNGFAFDGSLMRDYLSYNLARKTGQYGPRTEYCELFIDGEYRGLYILEEKIKVDENRVNIEKLSNKDIKAPDITGGYIIKADKTDGQDIPAWTTTTRLTSGNTEVSYIHEYPTLGNLATVQHDYIEGVFDQLQTATTARNVNLSNGYPSIIDVPSFIDFMLINELGSNVDAYQFSTFFHKDKNGRLRAGPVWDFNLSFGNDLFIWGADRSKADIWQFNNGDNVGSPFWMDLFNESTFKCNMAKRFNRLTNGGPWQIDSINAFIDSTYANIAEAAYRDQNYWQSNFGTIQDEIIKIKSFTSQRIAWMKSNLGSFSGCSNVKIPPLVITRIMYNPDTSATFPDSGDQEFIEITNNSSTTTSVAGLFFSGTGFVYQFPSATIQPGGVLQLANHPSTFEKKYNFEAYGHFSHNLSNKHQTLTLSDAFGNIVDQVTYSSLPPWPDASANGYHIKLKDISLDNSLGENWEASNEAPVSNIVTGVDAEDLSLRIYPNPADDVLTLTSENSIQSIKMYDEFGQDVGISSPEHSATISIGHLSSGLYLLKVTGAHTKTTRKVIKR